MNIYELCRKEPTELTTDEIREVVAHLRKLREEHIEAAAQGKRPGKREIGGQELQDLLANL